MATTVSHSLTASSSRYQLRPSVTLVVHGQSDPGRHAAKHTLGSVRLPRSTPPEGAAALEQGRQSRAYMSWLAQQCCEVVACYEVASDMHACTLAQLAAVQEHGKRVATSFRAWCTDGRSRSASHGRSGRGLGFGGGFGFSGSE